MTGVKPPPSNWNIANAFTALRLMAVPVFTVLLLHDDGRNTGWRVGAALAFAIAIITDRVDGELARRHGLITDLGKIADPIADKALVGAALISLSLIGELPWWVTVLILTRELAITVLRFVVIRHGVMPATHGGKYKTAAQSAAIMLFVTPLPDAAEPLARIAMAIAVILTVGTAIDYAVQAARLRAGSERTRRKRAARKQPGASTTPV